jgi:hypothetical protein
MFGLNACAMASTMNSTIVPRNTPPAAEPIHQPAGRERADDGAGLGAGRCQPEQQGWWMELRGQKTSRKEIAYKSRELPHPRVLRAEHRWQGIWPWP